MIRKNLLLFLFALLSILAQAQEERPLTPVEWSQIEKIAKAHPDSINALVARLTRPELDTTLSMNERCGQGLQAHLRWPTRCWPRTL